MSFRVRIVGLVLALALGMGAQLLPTHVHAQQAVETGGSIERIVVRGSQRVEAATVMSYMPVKAGDPFSSVHADQIIKRLFATGFFQDVAVAREGNDLIIEVSENPIINRVAFEGNKRIEDENLQAEVQSRSRGVYSLAKVQSDTQRITELYRRSGRFAVSVEPKIIKLEHNRVDLIFEINEGAQTKVASINFVGNHRFSDSQLREEIKTRESRWYRFFTSDDIYDPDRLNYDKELLRRFYMSNGYADFQVLSATAELTPDREAFFITFTVEEGEPYNFGDIKVTSAIPELHEEDLQKGVTTVSGQPYDIRKVEKTINNLTKMAGDMQFAFVDIRPAAERHKDARTVDLNYQIGEGKRIFVEKIDISGNVRTMDKVIRREMELDEGDPFNASKLRRSEKEIRDLGFFKNVEVKTSEGSQPDRAVIDVEVEEQSTGEFSIGAGFSTTDGPLADIGLRERNLLGRGQDLRFSTRISGRGQELDLSFTEPYFLERDVAAGFDVFHVTRDWQKESSYDQKSSGIGLRASYPLGEDTRHKVGYRLERNSITDVDANASRLIREQEGDNVTSAVNHEIVYDTRDSRIFPTEGLLLRFGNDLAGLGGDRRYLRTKAFGGVYYPLMEDWTLSALAEVGYIFGFSQDIRIDERFFLGGDTLRGFRTSGVGPRDLTGDLSDALGGNLMGRGSVELEAPIGLPEELGVKGHLFTDFGFLDKVDATPLPGEVFAEDNSLRLSVGVGISWRSPMGPLRVDLGFPIMKEDYDKTEVIHFGFKTRF